jgi:shikimate kinase
MMGAGKSLVGHCLHRRTSLALIETDEMVASKFGMSVPRIFSKHGEQGFREAETEALRGLAITEEAIIVTGGGIVLREENIDPLKRLGPVVWLDGNEATLFERASRGKNRPLLQTDNPRKVFSRMLRARLPLYAKIADIRIDTSILTGEEVAVAILSKLKRFGCNRRPESPIPATV